MTRFIPAAQPYDPALADDPLTRGALMHAAARGDAAAKLTIAAWRKRQPKPERTASHGSVTKGRTMFAGPTKPRADYDD